MTTLRLAVAGGPGSLADADAALAWAIARLAEAAAAGAQLLVLPQSLLGGVQGPGAPSRPFLSDAPELRALAAAASRHGVALACGYLETCTGRLHDAALFIDQRGHALVNYRRVHLRAEEAALGLAPGHWLAQVTFGDQRLGLLLGLDLDLPEPARALALAGATVLLVPTALGAEATASLEPVVRARAIENGCVVALANQLAEVGAPPSRIVGPDGAVLAAAAVGLAVADVPTGRPAATAALLAGRRPELYRRLAATERGPGEVGPAV